MFCDIVDGVMGGASSDEQLSGSEPMPDSRTAVVIEDDADIRELIATVLEQAGFSVRSAASGSEGIGLIAEHDPLLTTLDISMPGIDGLETARQIRDISATYIVMLTARSEEIDVVEGLRAGADDYLTKPFRPRELRARIEAMLRRPRVNGDPPTRDAGAADAEHDGSWVRHRGLALNDQMRSVTLDGDDLELTRSEFDILSHLLSAGRRVVSKGDLALMLRGESHLGASGYVSEQDTRAVEVHVANLRRKLGEQPASPRWVETVRGVGYRLTAK